MKSITLMISTSDANFTPKPMEWYCKKPCGIGLGFIFKSKGGTGNDVEQVDKAI